jgi:uncharacterized protein YqfB (UPF0267 family)
MRLLILLIPILLFAQDSAKVATGRHQVTITIEVETIEEAAKVEKIVTKELKQYKPEIKVHTQKPNVIGFVQGNKQQNNTLLNRKVEFIYE